jgi:ribonuclease D
MTDAPCYTTSADVAALCARLDAADFVAVDFEFMREATYYSKLCLIQLATPEEVALVDPLAPGMDLKPLMAFFTSSPVLKVFHAGGQDIEIIYNQTGRTPSPAFDTQIAAMALGYGEQVGYQSLMATLVKANIDKGARFTDWARRPLDERQLSYAAGDVIYLARAFPILLEQLRRRKRGDWLDDEMARLTDPATYAVDPDTLWRGMKLPSRNLAVLGRLKALAAWREREAMTLDLPRGRIIKDETLFDLAGHPPASQAALGKVRGLSERWASNEIGARLMAAIAAAEPLSKADLPDQMPGHGLDKQSRLSADLLKLLLKIKAEEAKVAPRLICRSDDLEALAAGERDGNPLMSGWRYELFGREALGVVEGRVAFRIVNGRLRIEQIAETDEPSAADEPAEVSD